jgi:hypothetical protein
VIREVRNFLIRFLIMLAVMFFLHYLLLHAFSQLLGVTNDWIIEMYVFMTILTSIHFIALSWLFKKWPVYSGFIFTGISLLKMLLAVIYLLPYIFPSNLSSIAIALNFMAAYLIILTFEVIYIAKNMLNNQRF